MKGYSDDTHSGTNRIAKGDRPMSSQVEAGGADIHSSCTGPVGASISAGLGDHQRRAPRTGPFEDHVRAPEGRADETLAAPEAGRLTPDFAARLAMVVFHGEQDFGTGRTVSLFTDALTGSTFSVKRGETVGQGLARFIHRWNHIEAGHEADMRPEQKAALS
jgi:hypothetical protein